MGDANEAKLWFKKAKPYSNHLTDSMINFRINYAMTSMKECLSYRTVRLENKLVFKTKNLLFMFFRVVDGVLREDSQNRILISTSNFSATRLQTAVLLPRLCSLDLV